MEKERVCVLAQGRYKAGYKGSGLVDLAGYGKVFVQGAVIWKSLNGMLAFVSSWFPCPSSSALPLRPEHYLIEAYRRAM